MHAVRVDALWADELETRRTELLHEQARRINGRLVAVIMMFAVSVPAWFLFVLAKIAAHVSLPVLVLLTLAELGLFALLVHGFRSTIRAPSVRLLLTSGLGACPSCTGPVRFGEEKTNTKCRYCGATLLATAEMQRAFIVAAGNRLGNAIDDRDLAELGNWDSAQNARFGRITLPMAPLAITFALLAAVGMTGGLVVAARTLLREPGQTPTGWISPTLLLGGAALIYWGVRGVQDAAKAKKEFEKVIGRPLKRFSLEPPRY